MQEIPETRTDRALDRLWSFAWPLLFLCTMTALSMATQRYSGYVEPQTTFAQTAQPSSITAR